ncbi:MAG: CHRD domain-containing protein [Pseudomonadota bacterium]
MNWTHTVMHRTSLLIAAIALAGCASMGANKPLEVRLSGDQEVPPVSTKATGTATLTVAADKSVTATIRTQGVVGVAAHIHQGAAGANGPVIVPLDKTGENEWSSKAGAKLTDAQYDAYKAGGLYFNVHSAANKGGEIRGQIRPSGGSSGGYNEPRPQVAY